jgi:PAS domain S-box-containing protein
LIRYIRIGYVVSSLTLVLIGIGTYRSTVGYQEVADRRQHSRVVITTLETILQVTLDAESSARGYALTGSEPFLEPYRASVGSANQKMDSLRTPLRDDGVQRARLDRLKALIDQRFAASQKTIEIRRDEGLAAAGRQVGTGEDKQITDGIRGIVAEMEGEERLGLLQADSNAASRAHATKLIVILGSGVIFLILGWGRRAIHQQAKRRGTAEEDLREERAHLARVLQQRLSLAQRAGRVGMFDWDLSTGRIAWTKELEAIFGFPEGGLEGHYDGWAKRVHPEDLPRLVALFTEWLSSPRSETSWEYRIFLPNGQPRWIDARAHVVRSPDGRALRVIGTNLDVTERKRAEEEISRLASIVESSDDAIISKTPEGIITSWNAGAERIYGYTKEEALGQSVAMLVPPEGQDELLQILDRIRRGERVQHFEATRQRKDGRRVVLSLTVSGIVDASGRTVAASMIARDVTEQKAAEMEIGRLNETLSKKAVGLGEDLESFSYCVSHDLRAPLRYMEGFLDLLENHIGGSLDGKGRHYLDTALNSARQMGVLIDDLLRFSRTGRVDMSETKVSLTDLVKQAQQELATDLKGRKVVWKVEALPAVAGDATLLRQVLVNLLGNAIKYTHTREEAAIEIGCREEGDELVFFVRDNGVGFDMRYSHKLFGVFQRLHTVDQFEGTGVGLAIVRRVIARHGGRTWAEGVVDQGATFYFSLPRTGAEKSVQGSHAEPVTDREEHLYHGVA